MLKTGRFRGPFGMISKGMKGMMDTSPCWKNKKQKKTIETITEFVMALLVIMGIVLVVTETVMAPVGLYWLFVTIYWWLVKTTKF